MNPNLRTRWDLQIPTYEQKHVRVWDYWTKRVGETTARTTSSTPGSSRASSSSAKDHDYLPDIPYIVIEHDHEPNSPEGIGDVEPLIDIQDEINRAFSHWAQLIADEIDPAYQIDADSVPPGIVPRGGEISPWATASRSVRSRRASRVPGQGADRRPQAGLPLPVGPVRDPVHRPAGRADRRPRPPGPDRGERQPDRPAARPPVRRA
jgi:hypothetical protein